jgi:hypothetical protein
VELGCFFLLIWASGNKFAVRHVEKRTAMFFLCRAFKKTHGKECLCRAFFEKRTAKVFS